MKQRKSGGGSRAVAQSRSLAESGERATDFYFLLSFVLSRPLMVTKLRFCQVLLSRADGRTDGRTTARPLILMDLSVGPSVGLDDGFDRDGLTGWIGVEWDDRFVAIANYGANCATGKEGTQNGAESGKWGRTQGRRWKDGRVEGWAGKQRCRERERERE